MEKDKSYFKRTRNCVGKETLAMIPQTVQERRIFLTKELSKLVNKSITCPALGNVKVRITTSSVNEAARKAARTIDSTIAALNTINLIKNAHYYAGDMPRSNKQKRNFQFVFIYILKSFLIGFGEVKIIVGVQEIGNFLHYSVTIPELTKDTED